MSSERAVALAHDVSVSFGRAPVLVGVDLAVQPGTHLAVTGRSGSGKSTLLLVLAGLLAPRGGTVTWPALAADPTARRAQIGMVFQAPSLMPELTALENVTLPLRLRGVERRAARQEAEAAMAAVDVADIGAALPAELSGGQQQRVAVARALSGRPRLVLADEPTGALDRVHARRVIEALRDELARSGGALVLATHDEELAALMGLQVSIEDGRVRQQVSR